jgi:hypothetical protein
LTVVAALAELLARFVSVDAEVTLAWLVIEPCAWGLTLIDAVALPEALIVPSEHVTVPADSVQEPCDAVAESNVTPLGNVSVTATPVAPEGPALPTVSE